MRQTKILYPLDTEMPESKVKIHKDTWKSIKNHLDDMKEGEDITFDQLLLDLRVTEENYIYYAYKVVTECCYCIFEKKS